VRGDVPRILLANVSRRSTLRVALVFVLGIVGRLAVIATAYAVTTEDTALATVLGVMTGATWLLQRAASASARVTVECDLYRGTSRRLLEMDVLRVPVDDLSRIVFEGNQVARGLVAQTLPALGADVIACILVVPLLLRTFHLRVLAMAALGFLVVGVVLFALRRVTVALQQRVLDAFQRVADDLMVAVEGRLEVVARGGEDAHGAAFDRALGAYERLSRRTALGGALLGRAPLVAGAATVALVVVLDASAREELRTTVFAHALLLAATAQVFLGLVMGLSELVRVGPHLEPIVAVLSAPARPEIGRRGGTAPSLPAEIVVEDVTFAYEEDARGALEGVSFRWAPPAPLLLVGPNGAGKSTLLRLLVGLRAPSRGAIRVGGEDMATFDVAELRRHVAFLPQRPYLGEPYLRVRDALRLLKRDATDSEMLRALERTAVLAALHGRHRDPLDVPIGELSAGQRQRIALARVLLEDVPFVLLDEPDANLDVDGVALVRRIVEELAGEGRMVAVAAHGRGLVEMPCTRVELGAVNDA